MNMIRSKKSDYAFKWVTNSERAQLVFLYRKPWAAQRNGRALKIAPQIFDFLKVF